MATYHLTSPEGHEYEIEGPEGASEQDLVNAVKSSGASSQPPQQPTVLGMAKQAIGETLKEDVPYLGAGVQYLRDLPKTAQEKFGTAAGMAALPVGIAAEFLPKTGGQLALQGAAGPVLEGIGALAGKIGPSIISTLDQIPLPVVKRAFERTGQVYGKLKEVANTDVLGSTVEALKESVKAGRRMVGQRLAAVEDGVAQQMPGRIIPTNDIAQNLEAGLNRAGFDIAGSGRDVTRHLSVSTKEILGDFKNLTQPQPAQMSSLVNPAGQPYQLSPAVPSVPQKMTFQDALNLRRKIDDAVDFIQQGSLKVGKAEEAILKESRIVLNERLKSVSSLFREANDKAARVFQDYGNLSRDVLSGNIDTIQRRITNLFNKGTIERRAAEYLDSNVANASQYLEKLLDQITASKFGSAINPVVERAITHTGGGFGARAMQFGMAAALGGEAVAHGVTGPAIGAAAAVGAVTSPRLGLEAIYRGKQAYSALAAPGVPQVLVSPASPQAVDFYNKLRNKGYAQIPPPGD